MSVGMSRVLARSLETTFYSACIRRFLLRDKSAINTNVFAIFAAANRTFIASSSRATSRRLLKCS